METQSQYDLEKSIAEWISQFEQSETTNAENAEEMKSHLRDSVSTLVQKGLSEHEAFSIATHRLGDTNALHQEYGKVNGSDIWRNRMIWMLGGYFLMTMILEISLTVHEVSMGFLLGYAQLENSVIAGGAAFVMQASFLVYLLCRCFSIFKKYGSHLMEHFILKPLILPISFVSLFLIVQVVQISSRVLLGRLISTQQMGQFFYFQYFGGIAIQLFLVTVFLFLLTRSTRKPRTA